MSKATVLRADAARNRGRLLEVAREHFTSQEGSVTLEDIARFAGVGIGTLYRHYPTREALVEAVYRSELDALMAEAEDLLREHSAFPALRLWMDRYTKFVATKHAMYDTLSSAFASRAESQFELRAKLRTTVGNFLTAGAADRTIRGDVTADDLTVSLAATVLTIRFVSDQDQLRRVLDLFADGLRPRN